MSEFLDQTFLGNTLLMYAKAIGILIIGLAIVQIFKKIILIRLKKWADKTETTIDNFIVRGIQKSIVPILFYSAFYFAFTSLNLSAAIRNVLNIVSAVVITFFAVRLLTSSLSYATSEYVSRQKKDDQRVKQLNTLNSLAQMIIWVVGILFLLDNLGLDISTVVAGLGLGGIAIAFAVQAILGDLFSYFVIFFDRPFELGDFIVVGDKNGNVEHIGIKSTRIRALSGEQLVFSNTDLTSSRIHNFKKLKKRRVVFQLGVVYETPAEKLEKVTEIVKNIIIEEKQAQFDRGHFKSFGDFSLNFEFVYHVLSQDYTIYMDTQQNINLKIFNKFAEEGIEFAYPTQTLFVNKNEPETN